MNKRLIRQTEIRALVLEKVRRDAEDKALPAMIRWGSLGWLYPSPTADPRAVWILGLRNEIRSLLIQDHLDGFG